jgi:hypothetical protein
MIVFDLTCGAGHHFEGWFASGDDFVAQKVRGLLSCPQCNSSEIERVPSATRINVLGSEIPQSEQPPVPTKKDTEFGGRDPLAIAQMLHSRLVDEIMAKTEDVGRAFPAEARKIFYEEAPARSIRGVASQEEHDALVDEGVPVARLPLPPSGSWN